MMTETNVFKKVYQYFTKPKTKWPTQERVLAELKRLRRGDRGALYLGGTLSMDIDSFATALHVHGKHFFAKDGVTQPFEGTPEIKKLVCELYVENKTQNHAYYKQAQEYLSDLKTTRS
jgi:hypothetical protein